MALKISSDLLNVLVYLYVDLCYDREKEGYVTTGGVRTQLHKYGKW